MPGNLNAPYNVERFRARARRRLPRPIFDFVDGAAEDELTRGENESALRELYLWPRALMAAGKPDLSSTVCGLPLSMPLICAPTGYVGVVHPDGELAPAVAAPRLGTAAVVSSAATYSLEELGEACPAPPWFQLYPTVDHRVTGDLMERAVAIGVPVLVVTVDVPTPGKRERDLANHWTIQPQLTARNAASFAAHPAWAARLVARPRIFAKNYADERVGVRPRDVLKLLRRSTGLMQPTVDWDDLAWIRRTWPDKLLIKGVLRPDDARRAIDIGADGVIVSNHGGRQLDGTPASIRALPAVADAVGQEADVLLDGGIRRGSDVVRALALGAKACLIGRPWVYGLAVGGTAGVQAVLEVLRDEIERTLILLGCPAARDVDAGYVSAARSFTTAQAPIAAPLSRVGVSRLGFTRSLDRRPRDQVDDARLGSVAGGGHLRLGSRR